MSADRPLVTQFHSSGAWQRDPDSCPIPSSFAGATTTGFHVRLTVNLLAVIVVLH